MKCVVWFVEDEEFSIGYIRLGESYVFICEEACRCEAPNVLYTESLEEAVQRYLFLDEDDLKDPEERKYYEERLKEITDEFNRVSRS